MVVNVLKLAMCVTRGVSHNPDLQHSAFCCCLPHGILGNTPDWGRILYAALRPAQFCCRVCTTDLSGKGSWERELVISPHKITCYMWGSLKYSSEWLKGQDVRLIICKSGAMVAQWQLLPGVAEVMFALVWDGSHGITVAIASRGCWSHVCYSPEWEPW